MQMPRREAQGTNPVAMTDENPIDAIKGLWATLRNLPWHGEARSLRPAGREGPLPRPPQLAAEGVEDDPESFSFWKIKHGIRWTGCRHGSGR